MNQKLIKFDNFDFNKLLAYSSIINSLNYKWYKSSKRRFLLPNFYFTRLFYTFYRLNFSKNIFRKRMQSNNSYSLFSPFGLFEKKMFLKHVNVEDFVKNSSAYYYFFKNKQNKLLSNDKFFFKKSNNFFFANYNLFVSKNLSLDLDSSIKLNIFKKNINSYHQADFDVLLFFNIFKSSSIEFYKIFVLLHFNVFFK